MTRQPRARLWAALAAVLLAAPAAPARQDQEARGICFAGGARSATVSGFVGGESHDSYIIHLREGRKLTVRVTSRGGRAEFTVSASEFGEPVAFGASSGGGRRWAGTVPQTGPYYISVVAHPTARYRLTVTVD